MSEMVERVAKAAYESLFSGEWPNVGTHVDADGFRHAARAAIAVMREPTEAMTAAGMEHTADPCWQENVGKAWQAMIDEALK